MRCRGIIRRHRKTIGSCWRKLNPGRSALLVLAYLRKGDTFAELAAGFGIGITTAWRYVTETADLLAAGALKLRRADQREEGRARLRRDRRPSTAAAFLAGYCLPRLSALGQPSGPGTFLRVPPRGTGEYHEMPCGAPMCPR
jgi:hypothetical protein